MKFSFTNITVGAILYKLLQRFDEKEYVIKYIIIYNQT